MRRLANLLRGSFFGRPRRSAISTAFGGKVGIFRHGLDDDHIAAIADISRAQYKARDAMRYGLLCVYGLRHATTVGDSVGTAERVPPFWWA
jgi:high-affinity nickel permease